MVTSRLPYGVGLAYRPELHREIMQHADELDVMEISTVDYIERYWRTMQDPQEQLLREVLATFPAVAHGISMSIGSVEPHDEGYLLRTRKFLKQYGISDFSEHLAFHRMEGNDVRSFLAMPFEEASLRWLEQKYNAARAFLGRPFALENVSYYFQAPGCAMDEADFVTEMTRRTDCNILLDVTNVFNNARNHGYDPVTYIRRLPGERIEQLHIAGGHQRNGMWIDSHSAPVMEPVWDLVHAALEHTCANMIFLERDTRFNPFSGIMQDVRTARSIFHQHRPACSESHTTPAAASTPAGDSAPAVDPSNPEFADLRSFQRALMRQITDAGFGREVDKNASRVQDEFPMSQSWEKRWRGCDQQQISDMAQKWPETVQLNQEMEEHLRQLDWQVWAQSA